MKYKIVVYHLIHGHMYVGPKESGYFCTNKNIAGGKTAFSNPENLLLAMDQKKGKLFWFWCPHKTQPSKY